jgi:hypothetical protein
MKTRKKIIAKKARSSSVVTKRTSKKRFKGAAKTTATKKGGITAARVQKAGDGAPKASVEVYEVIETQVYEEPDIAT